MNVPGNNAERCANTLSLGIQENRSDDSVDRISKYSRRLFPTLGTILDALADPGSFGSKFEVVFPGKVNAHLCPVH